MSKLYYPVNTSEKILNLQRGYTTAAECLRNHGPAGYDGVTQDTTPTPGYSVFNPPQGRAETFDKWGNFSGVIDTRDTFVPAAPQPELYRYSMRNRPAGYGTCPDGRIIAEDKPNLYSEATPHFGTVSYTRKLTEKELYKWEMSPDSENAYTWPIGATVEDRESGEVLIVSAHHPRNWYTLYSASHGEKWTVERTGQDIQAVTSPEPPHFDGDYDYTCDTNTYPQDMIIYTPGVDPALAELAALGLLNTQWEADGRSHFRLKYDRSILAIIDESKTEADLNELKENWEADPCWDIEHTVGFGLYRDDLKAYRLAKEAEWEAKRQADLVAFAEKIGATGNLVLAAYVRDLEYRLVALQEKYDKWYFAD